MTKPTKSDGLKWKPSAVLRKYDDNGRLIETIKVDGNLLVTAGLDALCDHLVIGTGATFDDAAVRLGVGDDNTSATITDSDLSTTTNQLYQPLDSAPTSVDGVMTFVASFGASDANFTWNCWGLDYDSTGSSPAASATPNQLINRKVFAFGTKSGGTWQLTVTLTLA